MSEVGMAPIASAMAALTLAAIAPGVFVIVLVAVIAGLAQLDTVYLAGMTGIAVYRGMGARQFESGIFVVVKDKRFPFILVMALLAFISVAAGVNVVDLMASHAFPCQVLVAFVGMATVARRFLMFSM